MNGKAFTSSVLIGQTALMSSVIDSGERYSTRSEINHFINSCLDYMRVVVLYVVFEQIE